MVEIDEMGLKPMGFYPKIHSEKSKKNFKKVAFIRTFK